MSGSRHEASRQAVLNAIRTRLGRADWDAERIAAARARIESRLTGPVPGPIPAPARIGAEQLAWLEADLARQSRDDGAGGLDAVEQVHAFAG